MRVDLSEHARIQITYTEDVEQRMVGNESFIQRKRSRGWDVSVLLYEEVGAADGR